MTERTSWTNRVHQQDAARAIAYLLQQQDVSSCYNISDCQPALLSEVIQFIRQQYQITSQSPWPRKVSLNKRVSSQRLQQTGFEFLYPSFQQGYKKLD